MAMGDAVVHVAQLEKFMRAVAQELKCLPSYADPDPEGGNAHIIRAIRARLQRLQNIADELKEFSDSAASYMDYHDEKFYYDCTIKPTGLRPRIERANKILEGARNGGLIK